MIILLISITLIWLAAGYFILYPKWLLEKEIGTLGDAFGILNTLFSGLAFAGLLYTIYLQKKELRETREEFEKQTKIYAHQKFDDNFFKLFEIHREIKRQLFLMGINRNEDFFLSYLNLFRRIDSSYEVDKKKMEIKRLMHSTNYSAFSLFMRYLNTLTNLLSQIDIRSNDLQIIKSEYYTMIETQMDVNEKVVLILYSATNEFYSDYILKSKFLNYTSLKGQLPPHLYVLFEN